MRRVKDYNSFLKESYLTSHIASKTMSKILDPDARREIRAKTQSEIESSLSDKGVTMNSQWSYIEADKGYVGSTPLFGGTVVLRELSEDEETSFQYEVKTGLNKGKKGPFEWKEDGKNRFPLFSAPYNSSYSDLLGPDEEFFKSYKDDYRWKSIIYDTPGIEIVKVGEKGECEIHYDDIYQLYGKVKIYYDPDILESPYFSYKVIDGPNAGKTGNGFRVLENAGKSTPLRFQGYGTPNSFSNGLTVNFIPSNKIDYPAASNSDDSYKNNINPRVSKKSENYTKNFPATGFNPSQFIYLNTSELETINPPSKDEFLKSYGALQYKSGGVVSIFTRDERSGGGGFINKSNYGKEDLWSTGIPSGSDLTIEDLPMKGNKWPGCFHDVYFFNDIALYSVVCKKSETPKLDFNNETGCYGNNFFSGRFLVGRNKWAYLKGEWYYDYEKECTGLLYAYGEDGKYVDMIWNPGEIYPDNYSLF